MSLNKEPIRYLILIKTVAKALLFRKQKMKSKHPKKTTPVLHSAPLLVSHGTSPNCLFTEPAPVTLLLSRP